MLLLFCSIILVLASSFFIANIFDSKNIVNNIICFFLSAFANVVLTFEILSLFSGISQVNVLALNLLFAILTCACWITKKCPVPILDFKALYARFVNAVTMDKTIAFLSVGFLFACIVSLFLIAIMQGIDVDSTTYRVIRAMFWLDHGNLNHFQAADPRILMFPINSEILYAWFILFLKNDLWLFIFNFCGVGLFLTVLYGILSEFSCSLRRKLWIVLIAASIPFVILRYTGLETGVIISSLALCSLYFYIKYLQNYKNSFCFMAALALALGVGTKTTVLLMMPALALWFLWYSIYCLKTKFYKPLIRFCLYFLAAFILFASYNYILNFINYGHFISALNIARAHSNTDGFLSTFSNLYRYIFDFFSFPEYFWSADLSSKILTLREGLLNLLNANTGLGNTNVVYPYVARSISSASAALGLFGPLLFIPLYIYTIYKSFCIKNRRSFLLVSLVYVFLITVFIMSYKLAFMSFNIRFLATFVMLTVPVLYYAYSKKYTFYKILISLIGLVYLMTLSVNVTIYPLNKIIEAFEQGASLKLVHNITECSFFTEFLDVNDYDIKDVSCMVQKTIRKFNPKNKILYFANADDSLMPLKRLMFEGYSIDIALATEIDKINMDDYNIIITRNDSQSIGTIFSTDEELDEYGYNVRNGVSCCYLAFDGSIMRDLEKDKVNLDKAVCYFDKDFTAHYNLSLINKTTYRVGFEADGSIRRQTYKLYENLNNPVIK